MIPTPEQVFTMLEEVEWEPFWAHERFKFFLKKRGFENLSNADVKGMADELRELRKQKFPPPDQFPVLVRVSPRRYIVIEVCVPNPASTLHRNGHVVLGTEGIEGDGGWLRQNFHERAEPLTKPLTGQQADAVLLLLQSNRRPLIPDTWLAEEWD